MAESVAVLAVVVVVAGVAGAAPVASSVGSDAGTAAQETPVNGSDIAPGERMAGVVGAEQAAVEGEVASRAFERRIANANSSTAKAKVVGAEVGNLQARLDELADREAQLRRAHQNGTLSTGEYRARLAPLYAEQRNLQRLTNQTERAARDLPERALRQQGVNVTALRTLRSQARNLTGPEVAAIARGIAGKNVGRPAGAGPPDFVENRTGGPPGNGTGPPGDGERGQAGNRSGGPGNGNGPSGNGTGAPGNETGAPGNGQGAGNETGAPEQSGGPNGNQTGGSDRAPAGNETGQSDGGQGDGAGNSTGGGGNGGADKSGESGNGGNDNGGDSGGSGNDNGENSAGTETALRAV